MNDSLRQQLKQKRSAIPTRQRLIANQHINQQLQKLAEFRRAKTVAAYIASKGEADPAKTLMLAYLSGKACYLPVLHPFFEGRLLFAPWTPNTPMQNNRFGIPEPVYACSDCIRPSLLDIVFTPLLGFDDTGHRLGMGGGFYDRTFAYRRWRKSWQGATLVGVAFDEQNCGPLHVNPWDISLDKIITQSKCLAKCLVKPMS